VHRERLHLRDLQRTRSDIPLADAQSKTVQSVRGVLPHLLLGAEQATMSEMRKDQQT
jgi:hypothetical protein